MKQLMLSLAALLASSNIAFLQPSAKKIAILLQLFDHQLEHWKKYKLVEKK